MAESLFWYDYETSGLNPKYDRVYQFAGLRTDLDFNSIGEAISLYCKPGLDTLPSPDACLITGLSPIKLQEIGMSEVAFVKAIHKEFSQPKTCVLGYNSIRFDDEFTRFTLYRNLYEPYGREWQGGNSRWDILGLVQAAYALRPEGINWPTNDKAKISLRLEDLSKANGLSHEKAHDAMSDVTATIEMAKLIKTTQPKLFDFVFNNRNKHKINELVWNSQSMPVVYCTSMVNRKFGHLAIVKPLFTQKTNQNSIITFDLRYDPSELEGMSQQQIEELIFKKKDGGSRPKIASAFHAITINRCPVVVPLNTLNEESMSRFDIDLVQCLKNAEFFKNQQNLLKNVQSVYDKPKEYPSLDAEMALYSGGFINDSDKKRMHYVHQLDANQFAVETVHFDDQRLNEILLRFKARNYYESLNEDEQMQWQKYCQQRLFEPEEGLSWEKFKSRVDEMLNQSDLSEAKIALLKEVKQFGESLIEQF